MKNVKKLIILSSICFVLAILGFSFVQIQYSSAIDSAINNISEINYEFQNRIEQIRAATNSNDLAMLLAENAEILNTVNANPDIVSTWTEHSKNALEGAIVSAHSASSIPPTNSTVKKWHEIDDQNKLYAILMEHLLRASAKITDLQKRKNAEFKKLDTARSKEKQLTIAFLIINSLGIILAGWSNILKE